MIVLSVGIIMTTMFIFHVMHVAKQFVWMKQLYLLFICLKDFVHIKLI